MGRPTKPRVKGNLQPASSSRAAELAGGGNSLGFDNLGGFAQFVGGSSAASGIINSRPATPSSADGFESPTSSADLDPELVVILKKVSKRDAVTKLKALEELETYLQSNKSVISLILHNWVTIYGKLVLEVDRRVRLLANQVHVLITANAKKRLAPLLKEFIGPWMLAMYDQSKDVAKVAQSSFEGVFSVEKRLEVIAFCQKEILEYVTDMLLFKTAETLSDARYVSTEDMHSKYGRIVSSSFQVVSYLITGLSLEERVKCQAEYDTILDDTTMWKKFTTHNNPVIRQALYTFIKALLLNWTELVGSRLELICPHFYASVFTEKNTSTHSDMWDALLLMTKKFPSSWIIIGKKKPALPKLYHFLRSGLNGSTSIAYPSMLALLANLPDELKNAPNFYVDVFDNFWKGLSTDFIDRSNSHIFLNAYAECIVYFAIVLSKTKDEQSIKIASNLIENTFWDMIKVYFLNSRDKNISDKLDQNGYAIIAKHLVVMASVDSVKECMVTFWSHMDELLVQTVVDCNSVVTRAPLDMDIFCQKTANLLTAINREIEASKSKEKYISLQGFTSDLSKRLVKASLESSIVHKDKSFGLLALAYQLLCTYQDSVFEVKGLAYATSQLLTLLIEGPENVGAPLTSLYVTVVANIKDEAEAKDLWNNLTSQLRTMINTEHAELRGSQTLLLVLEKIQSENIPFQFNIQTDDLDSILKLFALTKLNEPAITIPRPILESCVAAGLKFYWSNKSIPDEAAAPIISNAESNLLSFNRLQYVEKSSHALPEPSVQTLKTTLSTLVILQKIFEDKEDGQKLIKLAKNIESELFDAMFVTTKTPHEVEEQAKSEDNEELSLKISNSASAVWDLLVKNGLITENNTLLDRVKRSITDISYSASPSDSLLRVSKLLSNTYTNDQARDEATTAILGTEKDWRKLAAAPLGQLTNEYLSLAIVDTYAAVSVQPLIDDAGELIPVPYDIYGLSAFGRFALFLGEYLSDTKVRAQFFKNNERDWVMRQLLLTKLACEQGLMVPSLCRLWESKAVEGVRAFIHSVDMIFSDWFANTLVPKSTIENVSQWNTQLINVVCKKAEVNDRLLQFVFQLMKPSEEDSVALSANILQSVLQNLLILVEWSVQDLEKWIPLIKAEASELDLLIKISILIAFKNSLSDTDVYKHYQSDLASKFSGVSTMEKLDYSLEDPDVKQKTNYSLLTLLNASSLKFSAFDIPRQRLMYLIQGIRPLLQNEQDDYDFSSEQQKSRVQSQLSQLLKHLAESIQDVSGGHWEFFLQCCFKWVVGADSSQPEELVVVYNALDLFNTLFILSEDNEDLKDSVRDHLSIISTALLNLMTKEEEYLRGQRREDIEFIGYSKSRLVYQTLLAELLAHIPEKTLIDSDSFDNLNSLIHSPNEVLQKCAYVLLKRHVAHKVQDLSVRLEFTETSEEETHVDIDSSIFNVLLSPPDVSSWQTSGLEEQALHEILGYLLSWMLMFDHFTDITFKLKQEYTAQLKEKEAVAHLMLVLCKVLSIGQGHLGSKPFDLSPWSVIEYDTEGFDASAEMSYLVLASHLYYRALTHIPSLVRLWWIDCKQRQVTIAVESYTEKYFSQQLISNEIELVNRPDIKAQLEENEENEFTVKTLKAASEVTATYRVDEQNMQIAIKLPSNFPLRQIDVEGVQKVGVNDKQWRGWMFAVAAIIGSQNGNIVDALTVFKRNVNLHFSGVEDCTICYSIISIQDRSIPTKQCRTCKNKFHSSCLYKWFRSSNSASCPLCRTVF